MIYQFTFEDQIDTNDLKNGVLPLTVVADIHYDDLTNTRAAVIKTIVMSVKTAHGSTIEVPMDLKSFTEGTLNILASRVEEKWDLAMMDEGA